MLCFQNLYNIDKISDIGSKWISDYKTTKGKEIDNYYEELLYGENPKFNDQ